MADAERVVGTFAAGRKRRQAVALLDGVQPIAPTGQHLVRIGLVADIPHQAIVRSVEYIVQCNSEFHGAQAGGEMAAAGTDGVNQEFAQFGCERRQVSLV